MPNEELTFREKEIIFLKDFREKARGDWNVDKVVIAKNYLFNDSKNDSVIFNIGNIFINNIYNDPVCADRYNQFTAHLIMNALSIKVMVFILNL